MANTEERALSSLYFNTLERCEYVSFAFHLRLGKGKHTVLLFSCSSVFDRFQKLLLTTKRHMLEAVHLQSGRHQNRILIIGNVKAQPWLLILSRIELNLGLSDEPGGLINSPQVRREQQHCHITR